MQVRPHIVLLFILSVFTVLLVTSLYSFFDADSELAISKNLKIKFFSLTDLFGEKEKYADISTILAENMNLEDSATNGELIQEIPATDTVRANADSLKIAIQRLEFPNEDRTILNSVFGAMDSAAASGKVIRIMHYGDSQIEGDRITSFLRNKIQKKFGGCGVGLMPARQLYDFKFSVLHEASENWQRYTVYGPRDTTVKHNRFGILAGFSSFTKASENRTNTDNSTKKAWITIEQSPFAYNNTKKFEQCRLFYGYNTDSFATRILVDNALVDEGYYPPAEGLKQIQWLFKETPKMLTIEMEGVLSPEVYGIALDAQSGVAVDNVAMRGCAGLVFTKMNPASFRQMMKKLNVKLILLEFGGNIVPNIQEDYKFYENWFYSQLKFIKTNAPEVQIIVIGVADMSIKKNDGYVSYPNIELVRDALKNAAFRGNAAYWDMYKAMGGKNSMPSWVFAKPPLAGNDFVHFNPKGANIIANMFYNALMNEYSHYKKLSGVTK